MTDARDTQDPLATLGPDVTDHRLERPDGRTVAWAEAGVPDGRPLLRIPGTPGSRLTLRADRTPWFERGLRIINTERPGFGASTRLEGRGFDEQADDLAAILDTLGIDRLPVYGGSGASPHILAFAARHPDRVSAATILVGGAPMTPEEAEQQIDLNAEEYRLYQAADLEAIWRLDEEMRASMLADPLEGFGEIMATAPAADQAIMGDPAWQRGFVIGLTEALRPGVGGWYDEGIAFLRDWSIDFAAITADITWWHSDGDRNCPLSAAQRLVDQLPSARIRVWKEAGHLTPYHHEPEILDELLSRLARAEHIKG